MTLKRFLVFAGWNYYPSGGMEDFVGSSDSSIEAIDMMRAKLKEIDMGELSWAHIWDQEVGAMFYREQGKY